MRKIWHYRRLWVALSIFIALFFLRSNPLIITPAILCVAWMYDRSTLRPLKNIRFWFIVAFLVIIVPLFTGNPDSYFLGIHYSSKQLHQMLLMSLRGILVFVLFQVLTTNLDSGKTRDFLERLGISYFDVLATMSKDALPSIRSIFHARMNNFHSLRKQQGTFNSLIEFVVIIIQDMVRLADSFSDPLSSDFSVLTPERFSEQLNAMKQPMLLIISGDPGAGKTQWVQRFIALLRKQGIQVSGILSKKVVASSDKWSHQVENIGTGKYMDLNTMDPIETSVRVGKFNFYEQAINWCNQEIEAGLSAEWCIIDEVGLLEFQQRGFFPALSALNLNYSGNLIFTVRTNLIDNLPLFLDTYLPELSQRPRHNIHLVSPIHALEQKN